ncbi:MAG: hypothetical protein ACPHWZ_03935, partial [Longimicrobiales bacterium]
MTRGRSRVDVALPLPIHRTFTYKVDGEAPAPGTRVLVPFRREERIGWITTNAPDPEVDKVKAILGVLEDEPSVPADLL